MYTYQYCLQHSKKKLIEPNLYYGEEGFHTLLSTDNTQEISKNTGNTTTQNLTDICKTFHSVTENEHTSKYPWYVYRYTPMSLVTTITIKPELVLYIKIHFGINKHKLIFAVFSVWPYFRGNLGSGSTARSTYVCSCSVVPTRAAHNCL